MNTIIRFAAAVLAALAAGGALQFVEPGWIGRLLPELSQLPALRGVIDQQGKLDLALWESEARILARVNARKSVVQALVVGDISLADAGEKFNVLDQLLPAHVRRPNAQLFPGESNEEQCCLRVITQAAMELQDEPRRAKAVTARLHGELREAIDLGTFTHPN